MRVLFSIIIVFWPIWPCHDNDAVILLTIIVAVCVPCSPPPQHSPIFGHFASSQTVANFRSRNCCLIFAKFCPIGIFVFNQGGKRKRSVSFFSRFSLPSYSCHWSGAASGFCWTKSWNVGPAASRSRISSIVVFPRAATLLLCWARVCGVNY